MTPTTNTTASLPTVSLIKNDNSNPQQGTGLRTPSPSEVGSMSGTGMTTRNANTQAPNNDGRMNNTMRSPPTKKDSRKLFVGGLPADVTEDEFRVFFAQFGEIADSVVMFDRETHRSRGFGFVTYQDAEVANRLLGMGQEEETGDSKTEESPDAPRVGRLVMRGKTCEVKAAEPKESTRQYRRTFQSNLSNQGGSVRSGSANRRFVEKASSQGDRQPAPPIAHPYQAHHETQYVTGHVGGHHHHYPGYHGYYAPAYHHPGLYHGAGAYHNVTAPMYAHAAASVHYDSHQQHQAYAGQPVVATHLDAAQAAQYADTVQEAGHHHYSPYAAHPQAMHPAYHLHPSAHGAPASSKLPPNFQGPYQAGGATSSVMLPAAPGLPTKDE